MLSGASLRDCAERCGVCLKTSWFMRMRLCEVTARALQPFCTGESVSWQVDRTYLAEGLAGLGSCSKVSTNGHSGYARVLSGFGAAAHDAGPASEAAGRLGMANALH